MGDLGDLLFYILEDIGDIGDILVYILTLGDLGYL